MGQKEKNRHINHTCSYSNDTEDPEQSGSVGSEVSRSGGVIPVHR